MQKTEHRATDFAHPHARLASRSIIKSSQAAIRSSLCLSIS